MNQLRPEPRVNKNGVVVTKHVRASAALPKSRQSIPNPMSASPASKLAFLKSSSVNSLLITKLYPYAGMIAEAASTSKEAKEAILTLYDQYAEEGFDEWVGTVVNASHFIGRSGKCHDGNRYSIALYTMGMHYGFPEETLHKAPEEVKQEVDDVLKVVNNTPYLQNVIDWADNQRNAQKREDLVEYLCERRTSGTLDGAANAMRQITSEFLDFGSDEHDEEAPLKNLNHVELIEFLEYGEKRNINADYLLELVKQAEYKVSAAKIHAENYEGATPLIDGYL